jgi:hypothetical protein
MPDDTVAPDGIPADASGGKTVDPTRNVLDLVNAANRRQDDLREAERRYNNLAIEHMKEISALHAVYQREILTMTGLHQSRLDKAESSRIDSIREVDRLATATTAMQSRAETATLAASQAAQAETLRAAVANTATTMATQLANTIDAVNKRIASLEQASYEGQGKARVSDPALDRLTSVVETLAQKQALGSGKETGINAVWLVVVGAFGIIGVIVGLIGLMARLPK